MQRKYKALAIFGIIVTLLSPHIIVRAQEDNIEGDVLTDISGLDPTSVKEGEITNCFDTYKFGSEGIALTAGSELNEYKPYDLVEVSGKISNNNPYPVLGLTVRARVLRNHPNPVIQRALYTTVDDLVVADNILIKANSEYDLNFAYNISGNAPAGEYKIQYYVYNQNRFNLNGLSFTEDIVSNMTEFEVLGGNEHLYLDKTNITVDGQINDTRAFITQHEQGKDIPVRLPLINPTGKTQEVEVSYKLYKWDEILESNFIEERIQQITIEANGKIDLEYIVKQTEYPVYYMVIEANPIGENLKSPNNQEKTMAHIRFSVEGSNRPRVNWVGLNKNPFEGGDVELLTCVHNTVFETDEGPVKVQSIAKDEKGRELSKIEYEGVMPSAISGIKNKLNTEKKFNTVTIETSIYNASNELVDNIITNYDCNEISPDLCLVESKSNNIIIIAGLILLGILGGFIVYKRYKKLKN
jgi:LPXTG-motif cell wall-anchored protein